MISIFWWNEECDAIDGGGDDYDDDSNFFVCLYLNEEAFFYLK